MNEKQFKKQSYFQTTALQVGLTLFEVKKIVKSLLMCFIIKNNYKSKI